MATKSSVIGIIALAGFLANLPDSSATFFNPNLNPTRSCDAARPCGWLVKNLLFGDTIRIPNKLLDRLWVIIVHLHSTSQELYCDYLQSLKVEYGVQAPKHVLLEQEAGDDGNRKKWEEDLSDVTRVRFGNHFDMSEFPQEGKRRAKDGIVEGRAEIWNGDDWQTIELCLHQIWPRSCQDDEVGLGQDVIGGVPQGAVMGTEGHDVGFNSEPKPCGEWDPCGWHAYDTKLHKAFNIPNKFCFCPDGTTCGWPPNQRYLTMNSNMICVSKVLTEEPSNQGDASN
ncbi:hypothetical protein AAG570_009610 [Ranatra chinensis]|uniref:Uncharacterized protein n=1 Tax=Ranatra chinensis TaxID=642074 RepID=A0ABD0YPJ8_9HEMI